MDIHNIFIFFLLNVMFVTIYRSATIKIRLIYRTL